MRYRKTVLAEIESVITRLGLERCSVCRSDSSMGASPYPVLLPIGGFPGGNDPEANMRFMVEIRCEVCGHSMLFDANKFHGPDERILFIGTPEEEEEDESKGG